MGNHLGPFSEAPDGPEGQEQPVQAVLAPVRVIIKKDSGTQKKDSRRTPFLAK